MDSSTISNFIADVSKYRRYTVRMINKISDVVIRCENFEVDGYGCLGFLVKPIGSGMGGITFHPSKIKTVKEMHRGFDLTLIDGTAITIREY